MSAPPNERRTCYSAPIKTANDTASVAAHSPEVNEVDRAFSTLASRQNASPPVGSVRVQRPSCRPSELFSERMPEGHVHFARVKCRSCGRTLKWLAKPATIERQRLNAFRIAQLSMCDGLTAWERRFVQSLAHARKFSPRQSQILDRLCAEYLEARTT